jgi:DNA-binding response OmpR family regulator
MSQDGIRILVVDDESAIRRALRPPLIDLGFQVVEASRGEEALQQLRAGSFDVVLLDINMPGIGGIETLRRIRAFAPRLPILMVTVRDGEEGKVEALELGADDYITKPFSPRELVARVRSVLRGLRQPPAAPDVLRLGDLEIDASSMTVQVRGRAVLTTVREFRLLAYLAAHCGRVLTRDQLLDAVWRETPFVTPRSIDVYVRRLREKIEADPRHPRYLKTLRGIGYRFESPK